MGKKESTPQEDISKLKYYCRINAADNTVEYHTPQESKPSFREMITNTLTMAIDDSKDWNKTSMASEEWVDAIVALVEEYYGDTK